ncbi:MAG: FAD-dependent oxidoreductase [Candidatus Neomarinimicrobiota bacterium]
MKQHVVIVGGGLAGLTAGAFLAKDGIPVTLFEKEDHLGGLVKSFERENYVFDGGLRAVESSGLIISALNDLGIDLKLIKSTVSLGIEDQIISLKETDDINNFEALIKDLYPEESEAIDTIMHDIRNVMSYMMILLGNEAPVYSSGEEKQKISFFKTVLPWLIKLISTIPKIAKFKMPVEEYFSNITQNQALIDIIIQHFFEGTPASFALSYFLFYFDYNYPKGGTGSLPEALANYMKENSCTILTGKKICSIDPEKKTLKDQDGKSYHYDHLIWASDNKHLFSAVDTSIVQKTKLKNKIIQKQESLKDLRGAESVLSVYLGVKLAPSYFKSICSEHVFYTPDKRGLSVAKSSEMKKWLQKRKPGEKQEDKDYIKNFLKDFYNFNTFEISFPVLRDPSLAPEGKTGIMVSCLFDYDLCKFIYDSGWYEEFKIYSEKLIIDILDKNIFSALTKSVELCFSATPLSIERLTGNTDGAIVGWAFTNPYIPVPQSMIKVTNAVNTILPDVYQAGQWTYSPAGMPISLLTGKLAASKVKKKIK